MTAENKKISKIRLDKLIVDNNLAETRNKAQALIMSGQVLVDNTVISKPGTLVKPSASIIIKKTNPYVSRGGLKLEHALKSLNISVVNKTCMDIGASTGGFTDCLLQNGAKKVYAIDVGHKQLHYKLKNNPDVISMEGINFRYFSNKNLKEPIEFVTIDVSFISLEKIIPNVLQCISKGAPVLALIKPQFEASPSELKKGVIKDENVRTKTIDKIRSFILNIGLEILGEADSEIKGPKGNIEHFILFKTS
ncbi:MAG: TlyA family RNA methyltransferase [Endomicrobiales bacterium]|nr:TlyA family RNA methyltransferase [Endomicrobiales bacterium]